MVRYIVDNGRKRKVTRKEGRKDSSDSERRVGKTFRDESTVDKILEGVEC